MATQQSEYDSAVHICFIVHMFSCTLHTAIFKSNTRLLLKMLMMFGIFNDYLMLHMDFYCPV